jgi:hypothetical protein
MKNAKRIQFDLSELLVSTEDANFCPKALFRRANENAPLGYTIDQAIDLAS